VGLGGIRYSFVAVNPSGEQLSQVLAELEKGTVKAVIDSEFELKDARAAYEFLETGRARGKVVIRIPHGDEAAAGRANPGPPDSDGARETLFNVGLHCEGCANGVKGVLSKLGKGVLDVITDVKAKTVVVKSKGLEVGDVLKALEGWGKRSGRHVSLPDRI